MKGDQRLQFYRTQTSLENDCAQFICFHSHYLFKKFHSLHAFNQTSELEVLC